MPDAGKAAKVTRLVFRIAARHHPLVDQADNLFDHCADNVRALIAKELLRDWSDIRAELFADVIDFHQLESFAGYPQPRALLSRYNVAQIQAALFSAVSMDIDVTTDFKRILRARASKTHAYYFLRRRRSVSYSARRASICAARNKTVWHFDGQISARVDLLHRLENARCSRDPESLETQPRPD